MSDKDAEKVTHTTVDALELEPNPALDRKIKWRRDVVLIPILGLMYLVMFLDRTNIANARIEGLEKGLNMPSNGYNVALTLFYIPFVLFEIPSNLILSLPFIKPRWYLGSMMALLGKCVSVIEMCLLIDIGIVATCQGLSQSYAGFLAIRFIMGIFEAALPAAAAYMISMYYTKSESAVRFAWFFNFALAGPMFSGLLAYALVKGLNGAGGYEGWRWIFIVEGLMTIVFGIMTTLFTPNFPEKAQNWFLKPHEKERLILLLEHSRGKEGNGQVDNSASIPAWRIFLDWRIHLLTMCFFCCDITASSVSAFSPSILTDLGYISTTAQLMTMPIWAAGIAASFSVTWLATRLNKRWAFILLSVCFQIAGWTIMKVYPPAPGLRYTGLVFMSIGTFPQMPLLMGWLSANLRGRKYLAIGMAWQVGFGNCANFVSANMFIKTQRPRYPTGISTGLAFTCVGFALVVTALLLFVMKNRSREKRLGAMGADERFEEEKKSIKFVY